jgi:hypothetical protein
VYVELSRSESEMLSEFARIDNGLRECGMGAIDDVDNE